MSSYHSQLIKISTLSMEVTTKEHTEIKHLPNLKSRFVMVLSIKYTGIFSFVGSTLS